MTNQVIKNNLKEVSKDKNGNPITLIGYNFSIELKKDMYKRVDVLVAAKNNNIPDEIFRENNKRNSFRNALNQQRKATKKAEKVINFVEEDGSKIVFQLDHKIIEEYNKMMETSDGTSEMVNATKSNYVTDTVIIYDKCTGRILCDDNELLALVYKELKIFQESYLKRNISKYINNLLEKNADMIPWRSAGGVYFVPARYKQLLMNIIDFVTELDADASVKISEVPDMNFSCITIKESAEQSLKKDLDTIKEGIKELEAEGDKISNKMVLNRLEMIAKLNRRAEEYSLLVEHDLKSTKDYSKKVEQMIKNYSMFGSIQPPAKKEDFTPEQLEQLPEEILEMMNV